MLRAVVVVAVSGCNQFYGLDATKLVDASAGLLDQDDDSVADSADNCIDVANGTQTDTDGDGAGDACDACSFAFTPALDRDMDGLAASADNCPAVDNAGQTDTDLDGVGDACDPNPGTADAVRCYADVATAAARGWALNGPWKALGTDASAVIVHSPPTTPPFWLGAIASGLAPSHVAIQIDTSPPTASTQTNISVGVAVAATDETAFAACELVRAGTALSLRISDAVSADESPVTMSGQRMYLTLEYRRTANGVALRCTTMLEDGTRTQVTRATTAAIEPSVIYLTSTNAAGQFRSVSVYDTQD